jgi:soluble lytic murein transglycosylase-like protein
MPDRTPTELISLAHEAARAHSLWPELVCAVVEQESSWNHWALRYEPAFYARYVEPQLARGAIPSEGEARARAFSWGLMQVMGQVAREHGFAGASLAALCDPATGLDVGCRVLAAKLAAAEGNVGRALLLWNGGANRDYAAAVLARSAPYVVP